MQLSICPMTNNWKEMPKLIRYSNELGVRVCFNQVTDPKKISIKYLSEDEILLIVKGLKNETFTENGISFSYNLNMYSSFIQRLGGWAKEANFRTQFIKNQLNMTYDEMKLNTYSLFLDNRTNSTDKMNYYLDHMFLELENKYLKDRHLIAALNF